MTITYTPGIPNRPNNPSNDQPNMKVNNDANLSIWAVDHVTFNQPMGTPAGTHNHVTFTSSQSTPGLSAGQAQIYPQAFGSGTAYLETYTSVTPSSGSQINGYLPFVKCMTAFQSLSAPGTITPIVNALSINVATIIQTTPSPGVSQIVITFAAALPYDTYYLFFDGESTITSTITRSTTSITFSGAASPTNNKFFGFMVI